MYLILLLRDYYGPVAKEDEVSIEVISIIQMGSVDRFKSRSISEVSLNRTHTEVSQKRTQDLMEWKDGRFIIGEVISAWIGKLRLRRGLLQWKFFPITSAENLITEYSQAITIDRL